LTGGLCWFVLREKYCWLIVDGWFVVREKYCCLVADKPSEQGDCLMRIFLLITPSNTNRVVAREKKKLNEKTKVSHQRISMQVQGKGPYVNPCSQFEGTSYLLLYFQT
jgi:hypothetical protein